ncbi:MAG: efflux RND transporter periplasmic adaptor subunit [Paracoccaceae bacterium]
MKGFVFWSILTLGLCGQAIAQSDVVRPAKVFTVKASSTDVQRTYPAIVLPSAEVELSFRVSGRVVELPVRGAMQVLEGDLIAALDPRDFETQVAQLESQIDQANAELSALRIGARAEEIIALEAAVASAQAQVDQARDQAERTRELAERGVAASARLEQDEASLRVAEANLQAQMEQLQIGRSGGRPEEIQAAEAAIRGLQAQLQVARNNLDYTTLEAPFEGVIARRDIENFSNVQAGQSVALLQALNIVHLSFDVPGPDVTRLTANGPEAITNKVVFDALPGQIFDSETVEFSVQADAATQTYRGRVAVAIPETAFILPGMVGRVIASTPGNGQDLTIPITAVAAAADGASFVWVVGENDSVSARAVTLGDLSGGHVIVTEGLETGEMIVSAGVSQIIDGMTIRPITQIGG